MMFAASMFRTMSEAAGFERKRFLLALEGGEPALLWT